MKYILFSLTFFSLLTTFSQEVIQVVDVEEVQETIIMESTESGNINQYYQENSADIVTGEIDNTLLIFKGKNTSLYGLKDKSNNLLVKPIFKSINAYGSNKDRIEASLAYNQTGLIDSKGNIIIPFEYSNISKDQNIYKAYKDNSITVYDYFGNKTLKDTYEDIRVLNKYFKVKKNGLWGLIQFDEKEVLPNIYDDISYYEDKDIFYVKLNGIENLLNENHKDFFGTKYNSVKKLDYSFKFILAELKGKFGIINKENQVIAPFIFNEIETDYRDNLFIVKQNNKYGLYSILFKQFRIDPEYNSIKFTSNYNVILQKENTKTLYNYLTDESIDISLYKEISNINYGLAAVSNNDLKGVINLSNGKTVVPQSYSYVDIHSNYIKASIPKSRNVDMFTHDGKIIFSNISYFKKLDSGKYQKIVSNTKAGILLNSDVIVPASYDDIVDYSNLNMVVVKKEKKQGLISLITGEFLIPLGTSPIIFLANSNTLQHKNKNYRISFNKLIEIK